MKLFKVKTVFGKHEFIDWFEADSAEDAKRQWRAEAAKCGVDPTKAISEAWICAA